MRIGAGTVAVVTGAAGGLGRALTAELLARGATVAAWDVHVTPAQARLDAMQVDVTDSNAVAAAAAAVLARHGHVDLLINNAGVSAAAPLHRTSLAELERTVDVNYRGAVRCTLALLPALRSRPAAAVANVLSPFALWGFPTKAAYAASKAALRAFTETLQVEAAGTGLSVTAAYCGAIATDLVRHAPSWDPASRDAEHAMLQRRGLPPARVAGRLLEAIEARRSRVRIGADAVAVDILMRLCPGLTLWGLGRLKGRVPFLQQPV